MTNLLFRVFPVFLAVAMFATTGCVATRKSSAVDQPLIEVNASELSPDSKADVFREIEKNASPNSEIEAFDEKLDSCKVLYRFWLTEKKRAERLQKRIPKNYPENAARAELVKTQRRNIYEINLQRERIILIDYYIERLEEDIRELEEMRRESIIENVIGVPQN